MSQNLMRRLTFICTANVCRSPLMQFTLLEAVGESDAGGWSVTSRGTHAEAHTTQCEVSAQLLASHSGGARYAASFRSKAVSKRHCSNQHLLIAATLAERAELALLDPGTRGKTFTLREAIWLGEQAPSPGELTSAEQQVGGNGADPLEAYANLLHWRRGLKPLPAGRDTFHRALGNPLDLPDAHSAGIRQHTATLRRAREYTERFADQMLGFLAALN